MGEDARCTRRVGRGRTVVIVHYGEWFYRRLSLEKFLLDQVHK